MAGGTYSVRVEVPKLTINRLRAFFTKESMFGGRVRPVLEDAVRAGESAAIKRSPVRTGATRASIHTVIDSGSIPIWGKVLVEGNPVGGAFRYNWALNSSKKIVYHYRSGARTGRKTLRWFTGAKATVSRRLKAGAEKLAKEIEGKWQR